MQGCNDACRREHQNEILDYQPGDINVNPCPELLQPGIWNDVWRWSGRIANKCRSFRNHSGYSSKPPQWK